MGENLPEMQETWVQSLGQEERKWQSTPVSLPGKSHGQRSLVGYSPWGHKESNMTERLTLSLCFNPEEEVNEEVTFTMVYKERAF